MSATHPPGFAAEHGAPIAAFVRDRAGWAVPVGFALAFGASLAVASVPMPATPVLLGIDALRGRLA